METSKDPRDGPSNPHDGHPHPINDFVRHCVGGFSTPLSPQSPTPHSESPNEYTKPSLPEHVPTH